MLQVEADFQQLVEQGQADALLAVHFLAELLIGALGVAGEAVEARLQGVARLGKRLLEQLVLAVVDLAQGDDFLAETVDRRRADGVIDSLTPAPFRRGRGVEETGSVR